MKKITLLLAFLPCFVFAQNNLIKNDIFETDASDWTVANTQAESGWDGTLTHTVDGSGSFKLLVQDDNFNAQIQYAINNGAILDGASYTLSFWVRGEAGSRVRPAIYQGSLMNPENTWGTSGNYQIVSDDTWEYVEYEFTGLTKSNLTARIFNKRNRTYEINNGKDATIWIDDVSFRMTDSGSQSVADYLANGSFDDITSDLTPWFEEGAGATLSAEGADVSNGTQAAKIDFGGTLAVADYKVKNSYIYFFENSIPDNYEVRVDWDQKANGTLTNLKAQPVIRFFKLISLSTSASDRLDRYPGKKDLTSSWASEFISVGLNGAGSEELLAVQVWFRFEGGDVDTEVLLDNVKVTILDENGVALGVEKVAKDDARISLYPNPASSFITINSPLQIESVEVYNTLGQKAATFKNQNRIDASALSNGVYILKIHQEGDVISTKRFVKQ